MHQRPSTVCCNKTTPDCPAGDIDIFLCMPEAEAEDAFRKIYDAVQRKQQKVACKQKLMVTRSKNAITFYQATPEAKVSCVPVQVATNFLL